MKILSAIFVALGSACYFGTIWGKGAFGDVTADQLLINLTSPTEGMDPNVYLEGFEGPVFQTMLVTALFCIFAFSNFKIVYNKNRRASTIFNDLAHRIISLLLAVAFLAGGIVYGVEKFQLVQLYNAYILESNIIDDNYVDPRTTKMTFPEKKRNLIHIYLESLENSFLSKDLGGYIDENLMPELTELSYEGITFSDNENKFGGPLQATGTQWSLYG
jgi:phosphoglycerol transferase